MSGTSFTLKVLEESIESKAREMNRELGIDFYSLEGCAYEFIDSTTIGNYQLIIFRCPKSKSTISVKIKKGEQG